MKGKDGKPIPEKLLDDTYKDKKQYEAVLFIPTQLLHDR